MLGWRCYDRQIVDYVARDLQVAERVITSLDENTRGYIEAWAVSYMSGKHLETTEYARHLVRVVRALVQHGPCVIVGRGAYLILKSVKDRGLAVRVMAPFEVRVARVAEANNISHEKAQEQVRDSDHSRSEYLRSVFGRYADDPLQFDLVINTEVLDVPQTADVIVATVRARGLA
jgi:cytidylate kinase